MRCSNFFFQVMLPPCDATTAGVQLGSREELFDPKLLIPATSLHGGRFGSRHPVERGILPQSDGHGQSKAQRKRYGLMFVVLRRCSGSLTFCEAQVREIEASGVKSLLFDI